MKKEKIIFLLPPSEGKFSGGDKESESLTFSFQKPISFFDSLTQKDLKCSGKRLEEGIALNKNIQVGTFCSAIERYDGVMFSAIGYESMTKKAQAYFDSHFLILSGMYGIVKPQDIIGNYKLPIETKGLLLYWGEKIIDALNTLEIDVIVDLLPKSYKKMIHPLKLKARYIEVDFLQKETGKKIAHGVKKIKGEWVKQVCERGGFEYGEKNVFEVRI